VSNLKVYFLSGKRQARCPSDPAYPHGMDVDLSDGAMSTCAGNLPYPAECCGMLMVRCAKCGANAAITTAGRVDDPRTVKLACKVQP
jgi:hypothetical protein